MEIKSLKYHQHKRTKNEWSLEPITFENINLIAGQNATGKTKVINIIANLGRLFSDIQNIRYKSGTYKIVFVKDDNEIIYSLNYKNRKVISEKLHFNEKIYLNRNLDGDAKISSSQLDQKLEYKIPDDQLAALTKRDPKQHPLLVELYNWGNNLMHFQFGDSLGKYVLGMPSKKTEKDLPFNLKRTDKVVSIFRKGKNKWPGFERAIKQDMASVGYNLEKVFLSPPVTMEISGDIPVSPIALAVKEKDLLCVTDQTDMSQGMFRALSLLIQLNYAIKNNKLSCVLIDDIGEGLDYERSSNLIKLLLKKMDKRSIQIIMSTNDRFVMNNFPLECWTILHRDGNRSLNINYRNSKELFDEFELMGLNNFDFFTSKFFLKKLDDK
jgi:AAA domain, putative AbiEii toxin, Type IV TA system